MSAITRPDANTIVYRGEVYIRPSFRGVVLEDASQNDLFGGTASKREKPGPDDLFEALNCGREFIAEITIRRVSV